MKTAVVTGVSTGIGRDIASRLCEHGYKVFGSVRSYKDAENLRQELNQNFEPLIFDVTNEQEVRESVLKVDKFLEGNKLDLLINNAGIVVAGPLHGLTSDEFRYQFEVNLLGVFHCIQAYLNLLGADENRSGCSGKIINIGSIAGKSATPFMSPYNMSKFGLEGFSEAIRRELIFYGIDVVVVAPGPVKTPIWGKMQTNELKERYGNSPMRDSLEKVIKYADKMEREGYSVDRISKCVIDIAQGRKKATRYTLDSNAFQNNLLKVLPVRLADKIITFMLGLNRKR